MNICSNVPAQVAEEAGMVAALHKQSSMALHGVFTFDHECGVCRPNMCSQCSQRASLTAGAFTPF